MIVSGGSDGQALAVACGCFPWSARVKGYDQVIQDSS